MATPSHYVGTARSRLDGPAKVTGAAKYAAGGRDLIAVIVVEPGGARPVLVGEHLDHPGHRLGALVVAESFELARHGASLVKVTYAEEVPNTDLAKNRYTTVEACGSIGLWCSIACLYSWRSWIGAAS
jgi:xanthine dehydrogenase YagR molybdenum-binding subunit